VNLQDANVLAGSNSAVRIIFALGREGILHRRLGTTNRRDSPVTAWIVYIILSAVVTFALSAYLGPLGAYAFLGGVLGLGIIVICIVMNIGLIIYYRKHHRAEWSPLRHGVLPVAGSLLMLLPIYGQVWPIPAWPYRLIPYLLIAWIAIGVGYFLVLRRRRPHLVRAMGNVWEPDTAAQAPPGPGLSPAPAAS
jgi:amino acid transporter